MTRRTNRGWATGVLLAMSAAAGAQGAVQVQGATDWQAARQAVQDGQGVRALALVNGEGAGPAEPWHAGVRAMARQQAGDAAGAAAEFDRIVSAGSLPELARLAVEARRLATCTLPCTARPVEAARVLALPVRLQAELLEGWRRTGDPQRSAVARAIVESAAWKLELKADPRTPPHERATLVARLHAALLAARDKRAAAVADWAWQNLPTEPAVKDVVNAMDPEAVRARLGMDALLRHLQARQEGNDNANVVALGTAWCAGAVTTDAGVCPALPAAQGCEVAFAVGKALRQSRAYAEAEATLGVVGAHCPDQQARAWFLQGRATSAQSGGSGRAVKIFEQLAEKHATSNLADDALVQAGQLAARGSGKKAARRYWQKVVDGFPDGDMAAEASWWLAWEDLQGGKEAEARARFDAMVAGLADRAPLHWRRALYWRARAEPDAEQAATLMEDVVRRQPQAYEGALARGWLARAGRKFPAVSLATDDPGEAPPPPNAPLDDLARAGLALGEAGLDEDGALLLRSSSSWVRPAGGGDAGPPDSAMDAWLAARLIALGDAPTASRGIRVRYARVLRSTPGPETLRYVALAYPAAHRAALAAAAAEQKLPVSLLTALAREESAFDARVSSWAGAIGLTQLMPATAAAESAALGLPKPGVVALLDPVLNARLGAAHLARHLKQFNGNVALALGAYNGGPRNVERWVKRGAGEPLDQFVEKVPIDETRGYIKRVLETWGIYRLLGGEEPLVLPATPADRMVTM